MEKLLITLGEINRHHDLARDHAKTLALLRSLKAGEVTLEWVAMQPDGWLLTAPAVVLPAPIQERMNGTPETSEIKP